MVRFVDALTERLKTNRDFELCQTWMSVFLKCHGEIVVEDMQLREALGRWREMQKSRVERLDNRVGYALGVAEFLRSGR